MWEQHQYVKLKFLTSGSEVQSFSKLTGQNRRSFLTQYVGIKTSSPHLKKMPPLVLQGLSAFPVLPILHLSLPFFPTFAFSSLVTSLHAPIIFLPLLSHTFPFFICKSLNTSSSTQYNILSIHLIFVSILAGPRARTVRKKRLKVSKRWKIRDRQAVTPDTWGAQGRGKQKWKTGISCSER